MRKFTPGGNIASIGNGEVGPDLAPDNSGNLFFAQGAVVREINAGGVVVTIGGSGSASYYGDGGPAINAQLYHPEGVAVEAQATSTSPTAHITFAGSRPMASSVPLQAPLRPGLQAMPDRQSQPNSLTRKGSPLTPRAICTLPTAATIASAR